MALEDLHGQLVELQRRVTALEAHPSLRPAEKPLIRNMSKDGPKPSVPQLSGRAAVDAAIARHKANVTPTSRW